MNLWRKPVWQEYDGGVVAAHSNAKLPDHPVRKVIRVLWKPRPGGWKNVSP